MQAFDEWALQSAGNASVTEGLNFVPQQLGQMLDPLASLTSSGAMLIAPTTAVDETRDALGSFVRSRGKNPNRKLLFRQVQILGEALEAEARLAVWYPSAVADAAVGIDALLNVERMHGPCPTGCARDQLVKQASFTLADSLSMRLQVLHAELSQPGSAGVLGRLIESVGQAVRQPLLQEPGWNRLEHDLRRLGAELLASGRDGKRTAHAVAGCVRRAESAEEAARRLRKELSRAEEPFNVAFVIGGVREARSVAGYLCTPLSNPAGWPDSDEASDPKLTAFVRKHGNGPNVVLATQVRAFDAATAVELARERAQVLADQFTAAARARVFTVKDVFLVRQLSRNRQHTTTVTPEGPFPDVVLPRFTASDDRYARSIRYAASGRTEPSAVISVLQHWIALESLAGGRKADFVCGSIPPLIALASVRQGVTNSWKVFGKQCSRLSDPSSKTAADALRAHVGVRQDGGAENLDRWIGALRDFGRHGSSSREPMTQNLSTALSGSSPFVRREIESWGRRLARPGQLAAMVKGVHRDVSATVDRMRMIRHGAVHNGVAQAVGADQL